MATTASLPVYMLPGVPVHQPAHLEGDASLATEILPGPPSLLSAQQSTQKRDPRKPTTAYSYLPPSDPGSTYSGIMHGTLIGQEQEGPRSKRSRVDRGTTSRSQRASARSQLANPERIAPSEVTTTPTPPAVADGDPSIVTGAEQQRLSRAVSFPDLPDGTISATASRSRRKDKGKAREVEPLIVRVKEEPKVISLHSPEPPVSMVNNNEDHCSSCRSQGILVYCDGCPRAFHLLCLDPPLDKIDDGDSRWYCPACMIRKHPPRKPPPSLLSPLIYQVEMSNPTEFQLPDEIRNFYKDVVTGPKGTYVDASEVKQLRLNRLGQVEDRDAYRLRDRNGAPILCFRCGTSALPDSLSANAHATKRARRSLPRASVSDAWKGTISCDYCNLHWHLDCLDPPLLSMPPLSRKWMCPNHSEQVLPTKRRIPKQNGAPIEITEANQFNNGNIEIIYPEAVSSTQQTARIPADEVLINGRRYRVPERVILLDFWSRLHKDDLPKDRDLGSNISSPLTSLSSLDEADDRLSQEQSRHPGKPEELQVAQMLLGLRLPKRDAAQPSLTNFVNTKSRQMVDHAVQTVPEQQQPTVPAGRAVRKASTKRSPLQRPPKVNGVAKVPTLLAIDPAPQTVPLPSRRKKPTQVQADSSTRELRPRTKAAAMAIESSLTSISSKGSFNELWTAQSFAPPLTNKRNVHVKLEEQDHELGSRNDLISDTESIPLSSTVKALSKKARAVRRPTKKAPVDGKNIEKERRGRKRKEREDETQEHRQSEACKALTPNNETAERERREKDREKAEKEKKKGIRTPTQHGTNATSGQPAPIPPTAPTTPSLKIRLPRLNQLNGLHTASTSG
ncbi:hypothetical protein M378DRAFT_156743 [Amanita muscaria Koide BX008]|uniref:PHD-type domain-containing protein n=1 Tax=Amanita muscaria (strain Koide BX008) TaxID=946122 RepID=A0A0C2XKG8_AMAMK|nr:hypothetical protein M378DRAFT_156743 [Amanita muscaria Koide BX008]